MAWGRTVVLVGALGIAVETYLSDRITPLRSWWRALIPTGLLRSAKAVIGLHSTDKALLLQVFSPSAFFMGWYHGPHTATFHDLVPPSGYATALGLYSSLVNLFGMALAPLIIGRATDDYGLINPMHIPMTAQLIGGACFGVVVFLIRRHSMRHPGLSRHREGMPPMPSLAVVEQEALGI